jgi:hypothetical protein
MGEARMNQSVAPKNQLLILTPQGVYSAFHFVPRALFRLKQENDVCIPETTTTTP